MSWTEKRSAIDAVSDAPRIQLHSVSPRGPHTCLGLGFGLGLELGLELGLGLGLG